MSRKQDFLCSYSELWDVGKVTPHPRNPNTHPDKQLALLAKIIEGHGWRAPITVSKRSGYVIRGHGRLAAAMLLGCEKVPVDLQEYANEAEEYADMIADNRIAELAEIDQEELNKLVADLMEDDLADMIWTDPPYNVDYQGGTKKKLKIQNDKMSPDFPPGLAVGNYQGQGV